MTDPTINTQDELLDGLLSDFLDESDQLLTQLNNNLLQLDEWVQSLDDAHDQQCDADLLNEMFRAAHSIKGLSAMLGLSDINVLTHKIENVFDAARNHQITVNADVVDLVFMGLDRLTALVTLLKEPDAESVDCEAVLNGIRQLLRSAGAERKASSQADAERALVVDTTPPAPELPADPLADLKDEEDISDKYLSIFIDEAEIALDELSTALMALEDGPEGADLKGLMATAHKIKGAAASIGLNRVAKLAHLMEDLLEDFVGSNETISAGTADVLLRSTGALQQYVGELREGVPSSDEFGQLGRQLLGIKLGIVPEETGLRQRLEAVLSELRQRLGQHDLNSLASAAGIGDEALSRVAAGENVDLGDLRKLASHFDREAATSPEEQPHAAAPASDDSAVAGRPVYDGFVEFQPKFAMAGLKAQLIIEKLGKLGTLLESQPTLEQLDDIDDLDRFQFRVASDQTREDIAAQVCVGGVANVTVEPSPTSAASQPSPDVTAQVATTASPVATRPSEPAEASKPAVQDAAAEVTETTLESSSGAASTEGGATRPIKASKQRGSEAAHRPAETVRVDIERLDQLMDLAGQLVINKAQFAQIGEKLRSVLNCKQSVQALDKVSAELEKMGSLEARLDNSHAVADLQHLKSQIRRVQGYLQPLHEEVRTLSGARDYARDLTEAVHQLERVSDGIQQGVMDTRMVPVGPLFARFKRVVRDITRSNGKQVRLVIRGEKTELDKRMIDELGDPLVHMVRNSADHGIESPEDREAAGKPRMGTVTLDACHRGNSIVIRVSDDGKGLDTDRIRAKCIEKGILTQADADRMTPQQINQMIWEPGLTTAAKVTDVSGRGMGMDIVKSKIEDLNGTVDIESAPGVGTTITIKLPLTLAILPSLMVTIGGDAFAMPMEAVIEIVSVGRDQLSTVHGRPTAVVRGRVVSVVRLGDALSFHTNSNHLEDAEETVLVILGEPGREVGLVVDRVDGEEDIVIKSLADNYKNVHGIAGASILGDGRVSLILDTAALIDTVSQG